MSKEQKRGKETANVVSVLRSLKLPQNMRDARVAIKNLRENQQGFENLSARHGELLKGKSELRGQLAEANKISEAFVDKIRELETELAHAMNDLRGKEAARALAEELMKSLAGRLGLAEKKVEALTDYVDAQYTHIATLASQRAMLASEGATELIKTLASVGKDGVVSVPTEWLRSAAEILKEVEKAEAAKAEQAQAVPDEESLDLRPTI